MEIRPTKQEVAEWEELCKWLSKRYMHAAYPITSEFPHKELISNDPRYVKIRKWMKDNDYLLVFWRTGWGWQLRNDWEEKIDELKAIH